MFRLEAFIDDKKVVTVMKALDGMVMQMTMVPVRNAIAKAGTVAEKGDPTTGPECVHRHIAAAIANGKKNITRQELLTYARTYGMKDTTIVSAVNAAIYRDKLLKPKAGSKGVYVITKQTTGA